MIACADSGARGCAVSRMAVPDALDADAPLAAGGAVAQPASATASRVRVAIRTVYIVWAIARKLTAPQFQRRRTPAMKKLRDIVIWTLVAVLGAAAFAWLAFSRGEQVNAAWLLTAAVCSYAVAYRFY